MHKHKIIQQSSYFNVFIWARRAHNKTNVASQGDSTSWRFSLRKWWLEVSDLDKIWHERRGTKSRKFDFVGFGIARAQRA